MEFSNLLFNWKAAVAVQFVLTWIAIYFMFMRPRKAKSAPRNDARYGVRFQSTHRTGGPNDLEEIGHWRRLLRH